MSLHFVLGHCEKIGTSSKLLQTILHLVDYQVLPYCMCYVITQHTDPDSMEHRVKKVFDNAYAAGHVSSACRNASPMIEKEAASNRFKNENN